MMGTNFQWFPTNYLAWFHTIWHYKFWITQNQKILTNKLIFSRWNTIHWSFNCLIKSLGYSMAYHRKYEEGIARQNGTDLLGLRWAVTWHVMKKKSMLQGEPAGHGVGWWMPDGRSSKRTSQSNARRRQTMTLSWILGDICGFAAYYHGAYKDRWEWVERGDLRTMAIAQKVSRKRAENNQLLRPRLRCEGRRRTRENEREKWVRGFCQKHGDGDPRLSQLGCFEATLRKGSGGACD